MKSRLFIGKIVFAVSMLASVAWGQYALQRLNGYSILDGVIVSHDLMLDKFVRIEAWSDEAARASVFFVEGPIGAQRQGQESDNYLQTFFAFLDTDQNFSLIGCIFAVGVVDATVVEGIQYGRVASGELENCQDINEGTDHLFVPLELRQVGQFKDLVAQRSEARERLLVDIRTNVGPLLERAKGLVEEIERHQQEAGSRLDDSDMEGYTMHAFEAFLSSVREAIAGLEQLHRFDLTWESLDELQTYDWTLRIDVPGRLDWIEQGVRELVTSIRGTVF